MTKRHLHVIDARSQDVLVDGLTCLNLWTADMLLIQGHGTATGQKPHYAYVPKVQPTARLLAT